MINNTLVSFSDFNLLIIVRLPFQFFSRFSPLSPRPILRSPALKYTSHTMAPLPPTATDRFFANYQSPILMTTFATQVLHHQYIRRTTPAYESPAASFRITSIPRPLRAGLGWAAVFVGLLTQITLAKKTIRDYSDPVIAISTQRKPWTRKVEEGL